MLFLDALAKFYRDAVAENFVGIVVEQDAENLIIDDSLGQFGGAAQDFFHFEN